MVPRMGALLHLGLCLEYPADDDFRERCYDLSPLPADVAARLALAPYQRAMVNTPSILLYSTAFLQCMAEEKGEEGLNSLLDRKWAVPAVDRMLQAAGGKAMNLLDRLVENAQNGHARSPANPWMSRPCRPAGPHAARGACLSLSAADGSRAGLLHTAAPLGAPSAGWRLRGDRQGGAGPPAAVYLDEQWRSSAAKRYGRLTLCARKTEVAHQHAVRAVQAARRRGMGVRRTGLTARRAGARR